MSHVGPCFRGFEPNATFLISPWLSPGSPIASWGFSYLENRMDIDDTVYILFPVIIKQDEDNAGRYLDIYI